MKSVALAHRIRATECLIGERQVIVEGGRDVIARDEEARGLMT